MERLIIQGIKKLRVLTPYEYENMDELVYDLNNALDHEETNSKSQAKKGRPKSIKRRPKAGCSVSNIGCTFPKSSAVSEDSESSLDKQIHSRIEVGPNHRLSDSDEINNRNNLLPWRRCVVSLVESDSVNENFLPFCDLKRKRKFKRMAVDPLPVESGGLISASFSPKPRRVKSIRAIKNKGLKATDKDMETLCGFSKKHMTSFGLCGKRKRSMRERSIDGSRQDDPFSLLESSGISLGCHSNHHTMECDQSVHYLNQMEGSSSSLSSSESDGGIYTNDEGREGDDEQSDFFTEETEPGVVSMPMLQSWWETFSDSNTDLRMLFKETVQNFSPEASLTTQECIQNYLASVGREIRTGRRRLGNTRASLCFLSSINEKLSKFIQDPFSNKLILENHQLSDEDQLLNLANLYSLEVQKEGPNQCVVLVKSRKPNQTSLDEPGHCKVSPSDIKRRKRMPPVATVPKVPECSTGSLFQDNTSLRLFRTVTLGRDGELCPIPPPPPPPSPQQLISSSGGETNSESVDASSVDLHFVCGKERGASL